MVPSRSLLILLALCVSCLALPSHAATLASVSASGPVIGGSTQQTTVTVSITRNPSDPNDQGAKQVAISCTGPISCTFSPFNLSIPANQSSAGFQVWGSLVTGSSTGVVTATMGGTL